MESHLGDAGLQAHNNVLPHQSGGDRPAGLEAERLQRSRRGPVLGRHAGPLQAPMCLSLQAHADW